MQKGMVSEKCCNAAKKAVEKPRNWWLFEGCKRERSLKGVGLQPELLKNTIIGTFLWDTKENGLLISCKYSMNCWLF
jgi:hypothetical protein